MSFSSYNANEDSDVINNLADIYKQIYGADIRLTIGDGRPYMGVNVKNGDYTLTGAVSGNTFNDVINVTIQRFMSVLMSNSPSYGSNFIKYSKIEHMDLQQKIRLLKAEIMLSALKISQIASIVSLSGALNDDGDALVFSIVFTLVTGEKTAIQITG